MDLNDNSSNSLESGNRVTPPSIQTPTPAQQPINTPTQEPTNTPPPATPTGVPPAGSSSTEKPKSMFMTIMIAILAFLLISVGIVAYMLYLRTQATQELKTLVDNQLKSFTAIEKDYKDTEDLLKLIDKRQDPEPTEQSSSKQLLKFGEDPNFGESNVLGVEEDLNIDIERKMAEKFRDVVTQVDTISKNTAKIKEINNKSPIHKMFLPDTSDLVTSSEKFAKETKPLMQYLNDSTMLGIQVTTISVDLGLALNEAIIRGADEASLGNFKKKLSNLKDIKTEMEKIDISGLENSLQSEHKESLASFDEDMSVFDEIDEALTKKDINLLDKALSSLILQGQGDSLSSQVGRLSFWQSNKTIQSVGPVKQEWKDFKADKLN